MTLGLVASRPDASKLTFEIVGVTGFLAILVARPGVGIGLLVLGVLNGLPVLDTATTIISGYALDNYLAYALVIVLAIRWASGKRSVGTQRGVRGLRLVGLGLATWWLITVARSSSAGVPSMAAAAFGRNFLIFAALVILFPPGLRSARDRRDALLTLCAGAALYSVGQTFITVSGAQLSWLVHPVAIRTSEVGLTRVYAFMSDSAIFLFCLAIGAALLSTRRTTQRTAKLAAAVSGIAIILQQTRAIYISLPAALILIIGLWFALVPAARARLSRRSITGVVVVALLIGFLSVVAPQVVASYAVQPLSRLNNVFSQTSSSTGNIGYRFNVAHGLLLLLNGHVSSWLTGLGFLDPKYRYFSGLPLGSIRNSDLGLVDGIMLIGLIGVTMIYSIVAILLWRTLDVARSWHTQLPEEAWLIFGIAVWITQVLLASYSLGTLFQEQGQVLTAFILGVALNIHPKYIGVPDRKISNKRSAANRVEQPHKATALPFGAPSSSSV